MGIASAEAAQLRTTCEARRRVAHVETSIDRSMVIRRACVARAIAGRIR